MLKKQVERIRKEKEENRKSSDDIPQPPTSSIYPQYYHAPPPVSQTSPPYYVFPPPPPSHQYYMDGMHLPSNSSVLPHHRVPSPSHFDNISNSPATPSHHQLLTSPPHMPQQPLTPHSVLNSPPTPQLHAPPYHSSPTSVPPRTAVFHPQSISPNIATTTPNRQTTPTPNFSVGMP